jgi:hypothetical protein
VNVDLHGVNLVGILTGASFAAGLNVYATVATLGILGRTNVIALPRGLQALQDWWVIGAAAALFAMEFVADKIPAFDLLWNALQTFVRVPVAALIAHQAAAHLPPWEQMAATAAGGLIALAAHSAKITVRGVVTPSPEPFSNLGLSLGEDALAIFLTWLAYQHPYVTATIVVLLLLVIGLMIRFIWKALKRLFRGAERQLEASHKA